MLTGTAISKSIGGKDILSNVNVAVDRGQIVSLIGPSGCGKSTLLRNLSLAEHPTSGQVTVDEKRFQFPTSTRAKGLNGIHPGVTLVFQQFHLWPHLRVRENLLMPLSLSGSIEVPTDFDDLITYFEIDTLLDRHPHELSVGQKQRVAFARAVLLRPRYLLLDEITSALDVQHTGKMLAYIKKLAAGGTGILLATHLIGFAAGASSRVLFMEQGKVVEEGDQSILRAPKTEVLSKFLSFMDHDA
jgi:ABC-type polar amino acid transport system ATPase subunit